MPTTDSAAFIIRSAVADDRASVLALVPRLRAFGAPAALHSPEEMDAGERRTLERYFDAPSNHARLFVAEAANGAVLGAAYAERAIDYFTLEAHGHLGILMVAASAEGRGIGSALLESVERWARAEGYRFVTLNVFTTNARALSVYERAGYRADTVRYVKEL
jgi:GNAT superfamily N-acetyltransferase